MVNHKEAMENPELRQAYLENLVGNYGQEFPYVSGFHYLTDLERDNIIKAGGLKGVRTAPTNAVCVPEGEVGNCNSNIYFFENNFSEAFSTFYKRGVPTEDIGLAHQIELCVHETAHAEHFRQGISGFPLSDFDFSTEHGKALFMIASEIDAHAKHVVSLGELKGTTNYLSKIQDGFAGLFKGYMMSLPELAKTGKVDKNLARKIFDRYNELRFNKPSYELLLIP